MLTSSSVQKMKKFRDYELSMKLLEAYSRAALVNSQELIEEAQLLYSKSHFARTYYLALASIEETGKAHILYDAMGMNLSDHGLCEKIKIKIESHSDKITSAFVGWLLVSDDKEGSIKQFLDIAVHLKLGREKSMYTDIKHSSQELSNPSEVVRPVAAKDCIHLAVNCLHHTESYINNNTPRQTSSYEDKLLCINTAKITKIYNTEDFWEYYISQLEQGNKDHGMTTVRYHDEYFSKNKAFKSS